MIGYKAFNKKLRCRGFQFEVGKTYKKRTKKEDLVCCTNKGFHFCRELSEIEKESKYVLSESRICEVLAGDDIIRKNNKYCTNKITILREIVGEEKQELLAELQRNHNTGFNNIGKYNSGDCNIGIHNSRSCNIGHRNSSSYNVGNENSGAGNKGNQNSGNWNFGDCNAGNRNKGNFNCGDFNCGNRNFGFFNIGEPSLRMFNKEVKISGEYIHIPSFCYFSTAKWVEKDNATEEEKQIHAKEIAICGGFLKTLDYQDAWRMAWDNASAFEHKLILRLPNFNNAIFKSITGIDAEAEIAKEEQNGV